MSEHTERLYTSEEVIRLLEHLGEHVGDRRALLKESCRTAAADIGNVSPSVLLNWEKGVNQPNLRQAIKLLRWLRSTTDRLIS
jgi:DNA-binding XRE family transcriptional regulator